MALKPALSRLRLLRPVALASALIRQPAHLRQPRSFVQRESAFAEMRTGCCNRLARSSSLPSARCGRPTMTVIDLFFGSGSFI